LDDQGNVIGTTKGRPFQLKQEKDTPILDGEGNVVGTTRGRPFQLKEKKYDILQDPEGNLQRVEQGELIPHGYTKPAQRSRTQDLVAAHRLLYPDQPVNKSTLKEISDLLFSHKDTGQDLMKYSAGQAVKILSGDYKFKRLPLPEKQRKLLEIQDVILGTLAPRDSGSGGPGPNAGRAKTDQPGKLAPGALKTSYQAAKARVESMPEGPEKEAQRTKLETLGRQYGVMQ
jgi:hypothetical protein